MKTHRIEMNSFYNTGSRALSGRDYGKICRQKVRLDFVENENDKVQIVFDDSLYSLNRSFFLGFFGKSILKYKKQGFYDKFEFIGKEKIVTSVIEQGVEIALNENSSLTS